jgi:hypothetical protein
MKGVWGMRVFSVAGLVAFWLALSVGLALILPRVH